MANQNSTSASSGTLSDDNLVVVFIYPQNLVFTNAYGAATYGVYEIHEFPFIPGGSQHPPFPLNIQCRHLIANRILSLMQSAVEEIFRQNIQNDANAVISFLHTSEPFLEASRIMDSESQYFWAIILAKRVGVFSNEPNTPLDAGVAPQTPKRDKGKATVLDPSMKSERNVVEASKARSPSLLRSSPARTGQSSASRTSAGLAQAFMSPRPSARTPAASAPSSSTIRSPPPQGSDGAQTPFVDGDSIVPRNLTARLGAAGWMFFNCFRFNQVVVEQIGFVYAIANSQDDFIERMQLTDSKPPGEKVTPKLLEELKRRDQDEIRCRHQQERDESPLARQLRAERKSLDELRYHCNIARSFIEKGGQRNELPVHLLRGLIHLETLEGLGLSRTDLPRDMELESQGNRSGSSDDEADESSSVSHEEAELGCGDVHQEKDLGP
ncbi:hypothetical protein VNI00_014202 [Paramarasmius palmivorus]|uniref:Uncharacterized protein n=1 Tax=Paramarasmius palmivorus TaxID=297713 RepID=A0AAW0BVN8_9AGAR